jgi:hypothetical protein
MDILFLTFYTEGYPEDGKIIKVEWEVEVNYP